MADRFTYGMPPVQAIAMMNELDTEVQALKGSGGGAAAPVAHWFTGDGTTKVFSLPAGFLIHAVYKQGLLMRPGAGHDYTTSFSSVWTATFVDAPLVNNNICIMGVSNAAN